MDFEDASDRSEDLVDDSDSDAKFFDRKNLLTLEDILLQDFAIDLCRRKKVATAALLETKSYLTRYL